MAYLNQQGQRHHFDALVVGCGLAGLSYCLRLAELHPKTRIALICKSKIQQSNSYYAQGGLAAADKDSESIQQHCADTVNAGAGICNHKAVDKIISAGTNAIYRLRQHGVKFDKQVSGEVDLAQEGGHSQRRIYHIGDHTGKAIIDVLIKSVLATPNITLFEDHIAVNLITQTTREHGIPQPEVKGAYVLDQASDKIHCFVTKVVVLATGGAGKIYRYTSNPDTATGDGVAMAYRAGARTGDLEFFQFHPTVLYHPKLNNFLITEALRGEGAYLRHGQSGERFMAKYAPDKMELATRDIISRAIFTELENSAVNYVHLDCRHLDPQLLEQRFPTIYHTLMQHGIHMQQQPIPVVPAAHYLCGGVLCTPSGETDLRRLYAIGETGCTGLHGANRLASNSLLEAVVTAENAAEESAKLISKSEFVDQGISDWNSNSVIDKRRASQINAHWRGLRGEMTSYAGIVRTEAGLRDLFQLIRIRREMIESYYWKYTITKDLVELRNIALVAELIVTSALARQVSCGGHYREDSIINSSSLPLAPSFLEIEV